jgi:hypothetical protein
MGWVRARPELSNLKAGKSFFLTARPILVPIPLGHALERQRGWMPVSMAEGVGLASNLRYTPSL